MLYRCEMLIVVAIASGVATSTIHAQQPRIWTDASRQYRTKATFVDYTDGIVRLKKSDGKVVSVPIDKLSAFDRQYAFSIAKEAKSLKPRHASTKEQSTTENKEPLYNDVARKLVELGFKSSGIPTTFSANVLVKGKGMVPMGWIEQRWLNPQTKSQLVLRRSHVLGLPLPTYTLLASRKQSDRDALVQIASVSSDLHAKTLECIKRYERSDKEEKIEVFRTSDRLLTVMANKNNLVIAMRDISMAK